MSDYQYQVGGSLTGDAPSYVERKADTELYAALMEGEFCYVLNSRQMGKSSLLVRTKLRLEREGLKCSAIDMTNIGSENITPLQWYKGIVGELRSSFKLSKQINLKDWWQEREDVSLVQRLSIFINELLEVYLPGERLFIFIDEIDSILSLDFSVDDFFALIRFCYNQRAIDPEYKRITFAIFGVATPSDLIQDRSRTPFNIGKAIELDGFDLQQALTLAEGLEVKEGNKQRILKEILMWTGGQPFLTQKLCKLVVISSQNSESGLLRVPPGTEAYWVESLVRSSIIDRWESQDEPEHLRTIRDRIERNGKRTGRMLSIYQQILQGIEIKTDDSREQIELLLSGSIVRQSGFLKVKNPIYREIFNINWVEKQLASLRPYSQSLEAWIASKQTDESRLMRGQALKDALSWALGKSLSDLDYQYLAASQELSKRQTENALLSISQANQILSAARRKIKEESLRHQIWPGWAAIIALCVAILINLFRLTGLLQGMEWNVSDLFFRLRPSEAIDPRIVIVTIDERDLVKIGQWPMPDAVMVRAIKNIKARNPRAIGLDLYRDLPIEPGHQELLELFGATPNLVGVEKVIGERVDPPQILKQLGQVGFGDIMLDADGKIRRALISVRGKERIHVSFALQLVIKYLKKEEEVSAKQLDSQRWQLGRAVFAPFDKNDGGYVRADSGGYQIMLNFRGLLGNFNTISFVDVIKNQIPPNLMENRIILLGATAESLNDFFYTPYTSTLFRTPGRTPKVVVHANLTSQILGAVLDGRPMLVVWSKPMEWLWILVWSSIGAALSWRFKSFESIVVSISLAGWGLLAITYAAFLQGWLLPVIPPMLGLLVAAIALGILANKRLERIQLERTLELLLQECATSPTAGRIAIEYLKQSESDKRQASIERYLIDKL